MALAFETTYGTPPASGFTRMPFASATLGAEQPLLNSELLGYGRDPLAPIKDAVTADGNVIVPIDAQGFGVWLKAAFGQPTTTGTAAPYTHEFRSGGWVLPSMSIETGMPEVPRFAMYSGCVLDTLSWQMQRSGLLTATASLVAQGETAAASSATGTLADLALQRFGHFNGAITRNGQPLGNIVSAEITYANNLDRVETIRSDGRIDGAEDTGSILETTGSSAVTVTIPPEATVPFETGTLINITQVGTVVTTVQADAGVSLNGVTGGSVALDGQWSGAALVKRGADAWVIQGALAGAVT